MYTFINYITRLPMAGKIISLAMVVMVACGCLTACMEEEKFDTPAGATLRLSADTLYLDTVLTHNVSATKRFTIFNDNSQGVSITKIEFEGNKSEGFMVNIDGTFVNGPLTTPIDCRGKDSLFAFVQFVAHELDSDEALPSEAKLIFTLANGKKKSLLLQAHTMDVVRIANTHITANTTLSATRPMLVMDSLVVDKGATLTIAPGTMLLFHNKAFMRVEGQLIAKGSLDKPIIFRGDRFDMMFKYQAYDDIYGQWGGITFATSSYGNELDYCDIHAGTWGIACDSSDVSKLKLKLENSIVHNATHDMMHLTNCQTFVGNTQISNAGGHCLNIEGGDHTFVHCTIVSFCPFIALRGHALNFTNVLHGEPCPIKQLKFYNCIITGYANDEVFAQIHEDETVACNYGFYNCLLNTPEIKDNPDVVNNVWETSDSEIRGKENFVLLDTKTLRYDFRPVAESPARWLADPAVSQRYYPYDRLGQPRINGATPPDAGCYQAAPDTPEPEQ